LASLGLIFLLYFPLSAESPFAFVVYDHKTEETLGAFPPSRDIYAKIVDSLKEYKSKAIVFKYFLDQKKEGTGDQVFAQSLKGINVFLQARIDNTEKNPNPIDASYSLTIDKVPKKLLSGTSGWLPLPDFAQGAKGIGFVDIRNVDYFPMYEVYQKKVYKSLILSILSYAFPDLQMSGSYLKRNGKTVVLNEYGEAKIHYPSSDDLEYISYSDVANKTTPKEKLEAKIVLIGYDGQNIEMFLTPLGKISAHRAFFYGLMSVYDELAEK
jgi:hypothetical protein